MNFKFGLRSLSNLQGVHEDLVRVMHEAITNSPYDFAITEGLRTLGRQQELLDKGATTTLKSRHLTGHAVDIAVLVEGKVTWDFPKYRIMAEHIKACAKLCDVPIEWGGDWKSFKDGPHFQLPWKEYP